MPWVRLRADIAGDAAPELAIAPSLASWIDGTSFNIVDLKSGALDWSYRPFDGTFSPVAIGDVDGDGNDGTVVEQYHDFRLRHGCDLRCAYRVAEMAVAAGNRKRRRPVLDRGLARAAGAARRRRGHGHRCRVGQHGRITIFNGATHAVRLQIGTYSGGPLSRAP
jgi:hypothetical protein